MSGVAGSCLVLLLPELLEVGSLLLSCASPCTAVAAVSPATAAWWLAGRWLLLLLAGLLFSRWLSAWSCCAAAGKEERRGEKGRGKLGEEREGAAIGQHGGQPRRRKNGGRKRMEEKR
ncbi:hypothetical protein KY290_026074 [Solanum tuberosum]|uniref:Secreted protein n=1 Tax=Solanum tuberosum TaxID=4113 RepID=A0ABQ7UVD2_SOLTU|nr:hypothetical protein KY289_025137 [Solanum tuberosum]KAH0674707.1 hypothetical protein KY284_025794 [Solanum tuberosum]KAH0677169.1 hypothetical protein KY285_024970 [Solanum tuberosum]KAH0755804.1 hypothetical protein KY290_026074 [Solanum tuberosum]